MKEHAIVKTEEITMKTCKIGNLTIGQSPALFCTVLESSVKEALDGIEEAKQAGADCIELRIDKLKSNSEVKELLSKITFPSLVVCRPKNWDGFFEGTEEERAGRLLFAIENGAQAIDIETLFDPATKLRLMSAAKKRKIPVVVCYENMAETPEKPALLKILEDAEKIGADIAKVAVMANSFRDMLTVLETALEAKNRLSVPYVAIAMGKHGSASRPLSCVLGSACTYCKRSAKKSGAPGQLTVEETRGIIDILKIR